MVRDLDLEAMNVQDGRRLEAIADGLPLHGGAQLAIDTTIVSALHCDGTPHIGAADVDGLRLAAARRRQERTYPEFVPPRSRCRLVVLATEVGGRWSTEALACVRERNRPGNFDTSMVVDSRRVSARRWQLSCCGCGAMVALMELLPSA